jgi:chromosome segregation ATPase
VQAKSDAKQIESAKAAGVAVQSDLASQIVALQQKVADAESQGEDSKSRVRSREARLKALAEESEQKADLVQQDLRDLQARFDSEQAAATEADKRLRAEVVSLMQQLRQQQKEVEARTADALAMQQEQDKAAEGMQTYKQKRQTAKEETQRLAVGLEQEHILACEMHSAMQVSDRLSPRSPFLIAARL